MACLHLFTYGWEFFSESLLIDQRFVGAREEIALWRSATSFEFAKDRGQPASAFVNPLERWRFPLSKAAIAEDSESIGRALQLVFP